MYLVLRALTWNSDTINMLFGLFSPETFTEKSTDGNVAIVCVLIVKEGWWLRTGNLKRKWRGHWL